MEPEVIKRYSRVNESNLLEFYFCNEPPTHNPVDLLLSWAINKYQKWCWGWDTNVQHCFVRLGDYYYELSMQGLVKREYTTAIIDSHRVMGAYCVFLSDEQTQIVQRVLERQLTVGHKLNLLENVRYYLSYLKNTLWRSYDYVLEDETVQHTKVDSEGVLRFNLPYTCVTLANLSLKIFLNFEPDYDSHIPASLLALCYSLELLGIGGLWLK